jgi:hypothetical protein
MPDAVVAPTAPPPGIPYPSADEKSPADAGLFSSAEDAGFEPARGFIPNTISNRAH